MKKLLKTYSCLFFFLGSIALPGLIRAEVPLHTVKKTVLKRFSIGANRQLWIDNQYGDVVIKNWKSKNVLIRITLSGQSEELSRANALLQLVRINTQTNVGVINVKTIIDTLSSRIKPSAHDQCHISYQVLGPPGLRLKVTNRYGNIDVGRFSGDLEIDEKFGDIAGGNLSGPVKLHLEQGNIAIDHLNNGDMTVKGFQTIRIGAIAGVIDARFSSGNRVDMGLSSDLQRLNLEADNVKPLNLFNLGTVGVVLKVHTLLSKFVYNGVIQFKAGKNPPAIEDSLRMHSKGRDTAEQAHDTLLRLKKLKAMPFLKKENDYEFKTGNALTDIKLNVSFCVLNVKE
jgi:hypothetical protein